MNNTTIRSGLVDSINELTKALHATSDIDQKFQLRLDIKSLFKSLDKVITAELIAGTPAFEDALQSLNSLAVEAKEATDDINKIEALISKTSDVIAKIENVVKGISGVLNIT
jgi:ABC-type transporter Mla subunit MlaD